MAKGGTKILFGLFFFVLIVAGLAGGGAWYLTEHREANYRATALFQLGTGPTLAPLSAHETPVSEPFNPLPPSMRLSPRDYKTFFESDRIASVLLEKLGPESINLDRTEVKAALDAEVEVDLQTRDRVLYQQIIKLHFSASDPELAAKGANAWAGVIEEELLKQFAEGQSRTRQALQQEIEVLEARLAEDRQVEADTSAQATPESLETVMQMRSEAVEQLKQRVREAQAEAARGEASLKALKAYVSKAPPAVVLELSMAEAKAEAETAGARAESEFLTAQLPEAEAAAAEARAAWVEATQRQKDPSSLTRADELQLAKLRDTEYQLRLVEESPPPFRIVSQAIPPEVPAGPHRYAIVAGAAILGAIGGMIVYFGLLTLRVYARELDRS